MTRTVLAGVQPLGTYGLGAEYRYRILDWDREQRS